MPTCRHLPTYGSTLTPEPLRAQELNDTLQTLEALYVKYARRYQLHAASIAILNLRRLPVRMPLPHTTRGLSLGKPE